MRIFYDGFIYDYQAHGGINRYFNEIIARLPEDAIPAVSTYLGRRENWPAHPRLQPVHSKPLARWPALRGLRDLMMKTRVAMTRTDVMHPTFYQMLTPGGARGLRGRVVVTVMDMIHEIYGALIDPDGAVARAKAECIGRADAILCISENTRTDLVERFPSAEAKCRVTPLASSMSVDDELAANAPKPARPYFLHVGGRETYKNFTQLLRTWARFQDLRPDVHLLVVGRQWLASEQKLLEALQIEGSVRHCGPADDAQLAVLYRQSLALIYPSLYEGFGIPPLEAMRCGTAVICTRKSSLPEVCGEAALYFDPEDDDSLLSRMIEHADSEDSRAACIVRGQAQAQLFSWERTAGQTIDTYRHLGVKGAE